MLNSETNVHKRESTDEALSLSATSQLEAVTYIRDLASELQAISKKSKLVTLAFLLSMVSLQANEIAEHLAKPTDS